MEPANELIIVHSVKTINESTFSGKMASTSIQVSLHREPPEVVLVKKVIWKFVLVGGAGCAIPT